MSSTPSNWRRVGYVKIILHDGKEWSTIDNGAELDFSFDIQKPLAAVCMDAQISIYGMNWSHIQAIATWAAEGLALGLDNRIEVHAGYGSKKEDAICLFSGTICYAMPTQPPGRVLNIKARAGYYRFSKPINGDFASDSGKPKMEDRVTIDEWFNKTAELINGVVNTEEYDNPHKNEKIWSLPSFDGTATHDTVFKRMYNQARGMNPSAYLIETTQEKNGKSQFKLINELEKENKAEPIVISMKNGMVGMPIINYTDIEVTTLLNPSLGRGGYIKLESIFTDISSKFKIRKENNIVDIGTFEIYRIYEIRYQGQLRGEKWYSTVKAWRFWKEGMVKPI